MVDTYNRNDNKDQKDAARDRSPEKQSKRRCKGKAKPHLDKNPAIEQGDSTDDEHVVEHPSKQGGQSDNQSPGRIIARTTSHQTNCWNIRTSTKVSSPLHVA